MSTVDVIVIVLLAVMMLFGFAGGFMRAFGGFLRRRAFIFAIIVAFMLSAEFTHLLPETFLSFLPSAVRDPILTIVMGLIITVLLTLVLKLIGRMIKTSSGKKTKIGRVFGGVFMLAEYAFLIFALLALLSALQVSFIQPLSDYIQNNTVILKWMSENNPLNALFRAADPAAEAAVRLLACA